MFVGGALAAVLGAVIGYLGFRFGLRGFYFVLLTVAFAEICRIVALNTDAVGGALGLYITFTGNPRQFQFQDNRVYYYVALGLMLVATGVVAAHRAPPLRRLSDRDPRGRDGLRGARREHLQVQDAGDGRLVVPHRRRRHVLRVLPVLAPAQRRLRHPAVGRDHHPAHRRAARARCSGRSSARSSSPRSPRSSRDYFGQGGLDGAHLIVYGALLIAVVLFLPQGAYPHLRRAWARRRPAGA